MTYKVSNGTLNLCSLILGPPSGGGSHRNRFERVAENMPLLLRSYCLHIRSTLANPDFRPIFSRQIRISGFYPDFLCSYYSVIQCMYKYTEATVLSTRLTSCKPYVLRKRRPICRKLTLSLSVAAISSKWWGTGVCGQIPQRGPGSEPLVRESGGSEMLGDVSPPSPL